ncbi:DUF4123 domain-containing protein [Variovorax boronicumulans]
MSKQISPMSFQVLSLLHAEGADMPAPPPHPHCVALSREVAKGFAHEGLRAVRPYVLLERWRDNPLATAFSAEYPECAGARSSVTDDFFEGREDDAPCVVPLADVFGPTASDDTLAGMLAREWLGTWLEAAWCEARQRLAAQHFGAVIFSCESTREVARHLGILGFQTPPQTSRARLFRYQDPRVMQRVWPLLTPWQRKLWMGPVLQWWSLTQPWEAWDANEEEQNAQFCTKSPQWFKAVAPVAHSLNPDAERSQRRLFDEGQWTVAHTAPIGNRVWRRYADAAIDIAEQPEGSVVSALLSEGSALGLEGKNLEDFVWCSTQSKYFSLDRKSIPWHSPRWAPVLARVLSVLQNEPDASFGGVFHEIAQPFEKVIE